MVVIAIDGACRRNGKPDCVSAGGVFVMEYDGIELIGTKTIAAYELNSTSQRGEMLALKTALQYICENEVAAHIITDSEYLFNAMTKDWCSGWVRNGWVTYSGAPVKNKDLWQTIRRLHKDCIHEVLFFHVKGHTVPFGKVTAERLLAEDTSGLTLYGEALLKYHKVKEDREVDEKVNELSLKNNGFDLPEYTIERFVASNIVADAIATRCVEAADILT